MSPVRIRSPAPSLPNIQLKTMIKRLVFPTFISLLTVAYASAQEYKLEPISAAPSGLPAAYASVIQPQGYRVTGPSGPWCEVWLAKSIVAGKSSDASISFGIQQGTLLGVLRFPAKA